MVGFIVYLAVGGLLPTYLPTYLVFFVFFHQVKRRFHSANRTANHSIWKWVPLHYHPVRVISDHSLEYLKISLMQIGVLGSWLPLEVISRVLESLIVPSRENSLNTPFWGVFFLVVVLWVGGGGLFPIVKLYPKNDKTHDDTIERPDHEIACIFQGGFVVCLYPLLHTTNKDTSETLRKMNFDSETRQ